MQQTDRKLIDERRQRQSLEAQLNNERKQRKLAEEKLSRYVQFFDFDRVVIRSCSLHLTKFIVYFFFFFQTFPSSKIELIVAKAVNYANKC